MASTQSNFRYFASASELGLPAKTLSEIQASLADVPRNTCIQALAAIQLLLFHLPGDFNRVNALVLRDCVAPQFQSLVRNQLQSNPNLVLLSPMHVRKLMPLAIRCTRFADPNENLTNEQFNDLFLLLLSINTDETKLAVENEGDRMLAIFLRMCESGFVTTDPIHDDWPFQSFVASRIKTDFADRESTGFLWNLQEREIFKLYFATHAYFAQQKVDFLLANGPIAMDITDAAGRLGVTANSFGMFVSEFVKTPPRDRHFHGVTPELLGEWIKEDYKTPLYPVSKSHVVCLDVRFMEERLVNRRFDWLRRNGEDLIRKHKNQKFFDYVGELFDDYCDEEIERGKEFRPGHAIIGRGKMFSSPIDSINVERFLGCSLEFKSFILGPKIKHAPDIESVKAALNEKIVQGRSRDKSSFQQLYDSIAVVQQLARERTGDRLVKCFPVLVLRDRLLLHPMLVLWLRREWRDFCQARGADEISDLVPIHVGTLSRAMDLATSKSFPAIISEINCKIDSNDVDTVFAMHHVDDGWRSEHLFDAPRSERFQELDDILVEMEKSLRRYKIESCEKCNGEITITKDGSGFICESCLIVSRPNDFQHRKALIKKRRQRIGKPYWETMLGLFD